MNGRFNLNSKRFITLLSIHCKNHYEALGVTSKATQADIKSAYYKLSMQFHPDRNQGCKAAAAKFQDIKAAYDILSDYKARRLYDRGLLVDSDDGRTPEDIFKSHSSTIVQKQRPVTTGRTPIYNYDEWSRAHYGDSFQRKAKAKAEFELRKKSKEDTENLAKTYTVTLAITIFFALSLLMSFASEDLDKPPISSKK